MKQINEVSRRLTEADGLEPVLVASYEALDMILHAIRGREEPATGFFAALVMAAALAADGRDALVRAPSLPLASIDRAGDPSAGQDAEPAPAALAQELASLAGLVAARLADAGKAASHGADRDACTEAAARAREIRDLLAGARDD